MVYFKIRGNDVVNLKAVRCSISYLIENFLNMSFIGTPLTVDKIESTISFNKARLALLSLLIDNTRKLPYLPLIIIPLTV